MQFNVAQLLKKPIGSVREYDLAEDIGELDPEIQPDSLLTGTLRLLRTNSGVLVTGQLQVDLELSCSRCTEPIVVTTTVEVEESFRPLAEVTTGRFIPPDEFDGTEDDLHDAALLINDKHILDISEIVRQDIWLALPMNPACAYANAQDCPNFQVRLQEMDEVHRDLGSDTADEVSGNIDPRWAALLAFQTDQLDSDDKSSESELE